MSRSSKDIAIIVLRLVLGLVVLASHEPRRVKIDARICLEDESYDR
jgi:hypothetical protein